jgi:hypothetical protein
MTKVTDSDYEVSLVRNGCRGWLKLKNDPSETSHRRHFRIGTAGCIARLTPDCESDIVSIPMKPLRKKQPLALWWFPVLLLLNGCGDPEPECDSLDTRNSVVKIISDDSNNALVNYAVKNSSSVAAMVSNTNTEAEKLAIWEKAKQGAVYTLDDTILTNSRNRATRAVTCSGLLYVTVGDTTAQKQVDFKVERTTDGKISVSVDPFLF